MAPEISELQALAIDLSLTGFDGDELDGFLANADASEGLTDPDSCPEPSEQPATVHGDLWILGRYRLLCGDSTVSSDFDKLTTGQSADLVIIDPPYNVAYTGM